MLDLARELVPLVRAGDPVAAVTVTRVARSAPRGVGATMAVTGDARVIGSISGGCVEGDAVMLALQALASGETLRARFGFSDEQAHAAGLACGGAVEVLAYPVTAAALPLLETAAADAPISIGIRPDGSPVRLDDPARIEDVRVADAVRRRECLMLDDAYGEGRILVLSRAPLPRLIVLGAGEHAAALCRIGAVAGWSVTVCDAWGMLVTPERFPAAAELVVELPHVFLAALDEDRIDLRTAICVLTHDERLDVPALGQALRMPVGFVGAMGARSTVARRERLLRQAGVDEAHLALLHSPLGLDLGGSSPEETALSILAEIVAVKHAASGMPLRESTGPLHDISAGAVPPAEGGSCAAPRPSIRERR